MSLFLTELARHSFLQHALLAGLLASVACGVIGSYVAARRITYIAGGIARRYPETLQNGVFRAAFESKGRHRHLMERIPTFLITHEQPGLLGAAYCALELTGD